MVAPARSNRIWSPPSNCVSGVVASIKSAERANVAAALWLPASNAAIAESVFVCRSANVAMAQNVRPGLAVSYLGGSNSYHLHKSNGPVRGRRSMGKTAGLFAQHSRTTGLNSVVGTSGWTCCICSVSIQNRHVQHRPGILWCSIRNSGTVFFLGGRFILALALGCGLRYTPHTWRWLSFGHTRGTAAGSPWSQWVFPLPCGGSCGLLRGLGLTRWLRLGPITSIRLWPDVLPDPRGAALV